MDDQLPPPVRLYQLATGHYVSQAIYVAAALGIADLLADGPRGADELARSTGTHAASLGRVLRLLASAGVVRETADGTFDLTPVGSCLRSGPGSFRAVAQLFASPAVWASWGDLLRTVQTGETAWHRLFGESFAYFAAHPEEGAIFDEAMGAFTKTVAVAVAAAYDFSPFRTVIDVGGGEALCSPASSPRTRRCAASCSTCRGSGSAPRTRSRRLASATAASSSPAISSRRSPAAATPTF